MLVNHNGAGCLPQTLSALARNTETADVECLVVDSGSSDGSWEGVERLWEKARAVRFEENIGFCAGCNRGADEAHGAPARVRQLRRRGRAGLGCAARTAPG